MDLALFDFDGTITNNDNYTMFIRYAFSKKKFAAAAILLLPIVAGFKLKLISSSATRIAVSRIVFGGCDERELEEKGRRFASEIIPLHLRKNTMSHLLRHKECGDRIVVVSASPGVYLRHWCAANGLEVICTELEAAGGRMSGRYADGDCTGVRKAERVLNSYRLSDYDRVYAYGDTSEDKELLELAQIRYFRGVRVDDVPGNVRDCYTEKMK
jgi:HAD superfamily hydrolase (TIGR01490 family)